MKKLRVILMGTTDFAVPALNKLVEAGHDVAAVVAQPDRPNQRGKKIKFLPVKQRALELGIPVLQPEKIKTPEAVEALRLLEADVFVVAAYGQILSEEILFMPPLGSVNIHGSLLPKYRGAAPVHHAIIDGEAESGVTIMKMDVGMDTGDMLSKVHVPIDETTTVGRLHDLLAEKGAELLIDTLEALAAGTAVPEKQDEALATYADKVEKTTGKLDWNQSSFEILRRINGTDPFPSAYTELNGEKIKCFAPVRLDYSGEELPGIVLQANTKSGLVVKTGDGALAIGEIQMPGKKRMPSKVYFNGNTIESGSRFE
ncbi:methionyl-tRNA formyltransferase [Eubacterium sp. 1001713B170207_170306_E7]|uniref:methionyl-tRNA formyltransferase n=1 Tax=Eubacterium sp. 1001713B170207_170306_E7 TaxID=2787097 RepID=UPI001898FFE2|nr:methionyl-tRNA formyltransferase [Eubacterium sp. 1001713B170207_170306_E7]